MIKLFISPFDSGKKGVLPVLDRECNVPVYIYLFRAVTVILHVFTG